MAVQEFECQIARSQIGRYLAGEGLSSETLRQLGSHVAECGGCKDYLDLRKNALQDQLTEPEIEKPIVEAITGGSKASDTLISKLREQAAVHRLHSSEPEPENVVTPVATPEASTRAVVAESVAKPKFNVNFKQSKPFVLGGCLIGVLYFMNGMVHGPNSLLGPKASSIVAEAPIPIALTTPKNSPTDAKPVPAQSTPVASVPATTAPPIASTSKTILASKEGKTPDPVKPAIYTAPKPAALSATDKLVASELPKSDEKFDPAKSTVRAQTFAPLYASTEKKASTSPEGAALNPKDFPKLSVKATTKHSTHKSLVSKRRMVKLRKKLRTRRWHPRAGTGTVHVYDLGK